MADPDCPSWEIVSRAVGTLETSWAQSFSEPFPNETYDVVSSSPPAIAEGVCYLYVSGGDANLYLGGTDAGQANFAQAGIDVAIYAINMTTGATIDRHDIDYNPGLDYPDNMQQALFREGQDFIAAGRALWWLDRPTSLREPFVAWTSELDFNPHAATVRMLALETP